MKFVGCIGFHQFGTRPVDGKLMYHPVCILGDA